MPRSLLEAHGTVPQLLGPWLRDGTHRPWASSFENNPVEDASSYNGNYQTDPSSNTGTASSSNFNGRQGSKAAGALWENTAGLPTVTAVSQSAVYMSKDLGDIPGQGSTFLPTLGCKCGLWGPALAHPEIEFKQSFIRSHPDFVGRLAKLQVHMEDVTTPKPTTHWDATYDMRRFLGTADLAIPGRLRLWRTLPAVARLGTQRRFLTICPPEGGGPHQYSLKVTALDEADNPIEYFKDEVTTYQAQPPVSEEDLAFSQNLATMENSQQPMTQAPTQDGMQQPSVSSQSEADQLLDR